LPPKKGVARSIRAEGATYIPLSRYGSTTREKTPRSIATLLYLMVFGDSDLDSNPAVPQEARSATRFGDRQGNRHAAGRGAHRRGRPGVDRRADRLQPCPFRKRQANR